MVHQIIFKDDELSWNFDEKGWEWIGGQGFL